jgi:hypothetical protein
VGDGVTVGVWVGVTVTVGVVVCAGQKAGAMQKLRKMIAFSFIGRLAVGLF